MYLSVYYKAIVIKIRDAVLKNSSNFFNFEQRFGIFPSNVLAFSEENLERPFICKLYLKIFHFVNGGYFLIKGLFEATTILHDEVHASV